MQDKSLPVIAINREFGAGGRSLASILSERLNIPYYDRDFVSKTAEESGYEETEVEAEGEEMSAPSKVLNNFLNSVVSFSSSHDAIFKAEKKVILKLAESPCIMVGRCADRILAEAGVDMVSIYLHAPLEMRVKRVMELMGIDMENAEKIAEKRDNQRKIFYKQYTGSEIFDASNYTFSFDAGKLSIEHCAQIVLDLLENN